MAIVKLVMVDGEPRVLTKTVDGEVRVSCSCCETGCCMYPAQLLNEEVLTWEDLPEQIEVFFLGGGSVNMQRIEPPIEDAGAIIYYEETGNGYAEGENYLYRLEDEEAYTVFLGGGAFSANCLFTDPEDFRIQDLFADTYEVTGPVSGIVTRQSLCVWTGTGLTLTYRSQVFPSTPPYISNVGKWSLNGQIKSGFQDSPVGTYGDYSVSE